MSRTAIGGLASHDTTIRLAGAHHGVMFVVGRVAGSATQVWAVTDMSHIVITHEGRFLQTLVLLVTATASPDLRYP